MAARGCKTEVPSQATHSFLCAPVIDQIDRFVFDTPTEPFHEDVVQRPAPSVNAD